MKNPHIHLKTQLTHNKYTAASALKLDATETGKSTECEHTTHVHVQMSAWIHVDTTEGRALYVPDKQKHAKI